MLDPRRKFFIRIATSVALLCVFVAVGVSWAITADSTLKWVMLAPFLLGYVLLPRSGATIPGDEVEVDSEKWRSFKRSSRFLMFARFVYFIVAAVVFFGLPELLR